MSDIKINTSEVRAIANRLDAKKEEMLKFLIEKE